MSELKKKDYTIQNKRCTVLLSTGYSLTGRVRQNSGGFVVLDLDEGSLVSEWMSVSENNSVDINHDHVVLFELLED